MKLTPPPAVPLALALATEWTAEVAVEASHGATAAVDTDADAQQAEVLVSVDSAPPPGINTAAAAHSGAPLSSEDLLAAMTSSAWDAPAPTTAAAAVSQSTATVSPQVGPTVRMVMPSQTDVVVLVEDGASPTGKRTRLPAAVHVDTGGKVEGMVVIDVGGTAGDPAHSPLPHVGVDQPVADGPGSTITGAKLRGEVVALTTDAAGAITVTDVVEATNTALRAGTITVGRVLADDAKLVAVRGGVRAAAVYARTCAVAAESGGVSIDTIHGAGTITMAPGNEGDVVVGGLTGRLAVTAHGVVRLDIDELSGDTVIDTAGDVFITLAPPIAVEMAVASPRGFIIIPGLTGLMREQRPPDLAALAPRAPAALLDTMAAQQWAVRGKLTVAQAAPPLSARVYDPDDPDAYHRAMAAHAASIAGGGTGGGSTGSGRGGLGGSGKIRQDAAAASAATGSFYASRAAGQAGDALPALIVLSRGGTVKVEVMTWSERVKARAAAKVPPRFVPPPQLK